MKKFNFFPVIRKHAVETDRRDIYVSTATAAAAGVCESENREKEKYQTLNIAQHKQWGNIFNNETFSDIFKAIHIGSISHRTWARPCYRGAASIINS